MSAFITPPPAVNLQASSPGIAQTGNANITGASLVRSIRAATVTAGENAGYFSATTVDAIYATSTSGAGVQASSPVAGVIAGTTVGSGLLATATSGYGVNASSDTGTSGIFRSSTSGNTSPTLITKLNIGQTSNLFEAQDGTAAVLSAITKDGYFTGPAYALRSATTSVSTVAATAPTSGQVLTATGASTATWQTPTGSTTLTVTANTAGVGSPNILTSADSSKVWTNEGATALNYQTLPTAVAGLYFTFIVQDADGIRVTADTGDTIRMATAVTPTAGHVDSTEIGASVTFVAINATEWLATTIVGTWIVTT